jgi:tRNA-dihydrouridine synthase A
MPSRSQILTAMLPYIDTWIDRGWRLNSITRHMLQLFHGQPGSRSWRRLITEQSVLPGAGIEVLEQALKGLKDRTVGASKQSILDF